MRVQSGLLAVSLVACSLANAGNTPSGRALAKSISATVSFSPQDSGNFSDEDLDELLSPIALYPDPLLAQVLPAATFVDQIDEAQRTLNGKSDDNLISDQNWDVSVKSVAHYPMVLQMMYQKRDWTTALGQAYVNQSTDVEKAIQRLRAEAREAGSLVSNEQQKIAVDQAQGETVIRIEPAQPQVIYVPQYDPEVVYVDSGPSTGDVVAASLISFGAGMAIGAWLNRDWRWYGGGPYYHGWSGGGWVGYSRSYVNVNRSVYVNNTYRNVNVNRNIRTRNISGYRNTLHRDATVRRERTRNRDVARNRDRDVTRDRDRNRDVTGDRNRDRNKGSFDSRNDAFKARDRDADKLDKYRGHDKRDRGGLDSTRDRGGLDSTRDRRDAQRAGAGSDRANKRDFKQSGHNSAFGGNKSGREVKQDRNRGSDSLASMKKSKQGGGNFGGGGGKHGGGGGAKRGGGGGGGGAKRGGGGGRR
jgi:hypothetical protein